MIVRKTLKKQRVRIRNKKGTIGVRVREKERKTDRVRERSNWIEKEEAKWNLNNDGLPEEPAAS